MNQRRDFLKKSAMFAAGGILAPTAVPASASGELLTAQEAPVQLKSAETNPLALTFHRLAVRRIWACIAPLPQGYPYRYVLLTMDRHNFPGITGRQWSYGALYFYGAI